MRNLLNDKTNDKSSKTDSLVIMDSKRKKCLEYKMLFIEKNIIKYYYIYKTSKKVILL